MSFLKRIGDIVNSRNKFTSGEKVHEPMKQTAVKNQGQELERAAGAGNMREPEMSVAQERLERMKALTPREWEVYEHLILGLKMREIAQLLGVTYSTVNFHCQGVYKKLGVNTRAQLFIQYSVLEPDNVKRAREGKI